MKAFIANLVEKADLSEDQATKVAEVLRQFLGDRLPEMIREPVLAALTGEHVDSGADMARDLLGSLLK